MSRAHEMTVPDPDEVTDADAARELAITWQAWMAERSLSYGELADWQGAFEAIGERFGLTEEFKENGIC